MAQHALVLGLGHAVLPDTSATPTMGDPIGSTVHSDLQNLNLHAWLLEQRVFGNKASLAKWQRELRLLREALPDQCMKQSGPFLSVGATTTTWTSGLPL